MSRKSSWWERVLWVRRRAWRRSWPAPACYLVETGTLSKGARWCKELDTGVLLALEFARGRARGTGKGPGRVILGASHGLAVVDVFCPGRNAAVVHAGFGVSCSCQALMLSKGPVG